MLRSLYSGISGLQVSGMKMSVVGDNIANSQTIGFKKAIPIFQDMLAQSISSYSSGSQIGLGARTAAIWQDFSQAAIQNTNRALDLSINGTGFFVLQNQASSEDNGTPITTAQYYTRAGAFDLDKNGYVVNANGYILQGYTVDPFTGEVGTGPQDIQIDATRTDPQATSGIDLSVNLDPSVDAHSAFVYYVDSDTFTSGDTEIHNDFTYYLTGSNSFEVGSAVDTDGGTFSFDLTGGTNDSTVSITISATHSLADVVSSLNTALGALTSYTGTASAVSMGGGSFALRITPGDSAWSISGITDGTDNGGLGVTASGITSQGNDATISFSFGTATDASTVTVTVADNTTLNSLATELTSALALNGYSGTATVVSTASGAYLRIQSNDADWSVQGAITDTTSSSLNLTESTTTGENFDATNSDTYDYSTSIYIYDQQGRSHACNIYFVKTDENTWDFYALSPDDANYTATPGAPTGSMIFDETGALHTVMDGNGNTLPTGTNPDVTFTFVEDETLTPVDLTVSLDFTPRGTYGNTTQNDSSFVNYYTGQNGYGPGSLESLEVDAQGVIMGNYSNGESLAVARVALATFQGEQGLNRTGGTMWSSTRASGEASINPASEGGTGTVYGFSLEEANVDMAEEFVDMIVAQRAWQANAKTISTADQMLSELMNIKR